MLNSEFVGVVVVLIRIIVPAWKLPELVAFVNVIPVEETFVARSVDTVVLPLPFTLNCVEEPTWK